jgi:hypothetical protein
MKSYKFSRRSFIEATGAAIGLHTLLSNAEAQAQGTATTPKRLLITHHPVGTCRYAWNPTGSGSTYTTSRIFKPFEDAMLRNDMVIVDGLDMDTIGGPGGGHEKGTVIMSTGTATRGTRTGQTETDDPMAAGPSFDQVLLALRPELARPFPTLYALCDDRIDFQEISTRCMSYSMETRPQSAVGWEGGGSSFEHTPLRPTLKPLDLYTRVFGKMMPGGDTAALVKARAAKKSALDFSLRELAKLRTLAPASQRPLLDAHEAAIRALELQLDSQGMGCSAPMAPASSLSSTADDGKDHNNYQGNDGASKADDVNHQAVGEAHQAIIRTAFQCDLTRVGLFQFSPGTNHVAFSAGMHPGQPNAILMHHPVSHRIQVADQINKDNADAEFLVNVEIWYNKRLAEFLNTLKVKDLNDPAGGTLLDNMVVPYLTEVSETLHGHHPMPLAIFGGKNLGFKGGQYLKFNGRPYNDLWLTIFAAFGITAAELQGLTVNNVKGAPMLRSPNQGVLAGVRG